MGRVGGDLLDSPVCLVHRGLSGDVAREVVADEEVVAPPVPRIAFQGIQQRAVVVAAKGTVSDEALRVLEAGVRLELRRRQHGAEEVMAAPRRLTAITAECSGKGRLRDGHQSVFSLLAEPGDLLCSGAKEEEVLLPNLFSDLHVCAVQGADYHAAIQRELHVAGPARLHARRADVLGQLAPRDEHLGHRDAVVRNEDDLLPGFISGRLSPIRHAAK